MGKNLILNNDISNFCDAIDIDFQVDFVRQYEKIGDSQLYGGKHCGSDAEHKGSALIAEKLKEIGLSNVEMIPIATARYQFNDALITIAGEEKEIRPYGYVSPGTATDGLEAELIDAIKCRRNLAAIDIKDKIVLMAAMGTLEGANLSGQIEMAMKYGAKAIVIYAVEDVLNEKTIRVQPPNVICSVPVVGICAKDADWLKEKLAECRIHLYVDAEFKAEGGVTYNVTGEIPGNMSDERIIYTAHLDHYFRCLQDNMSTCSTLLGIAKAMIDSGYKPNRTISFVFHGSHETGGQDTRYPYIFGSYKMTHECKPEWTGKAVANINFEYTALRMKKLQAAAYTGLNAIPIGYFEYSPELVEGGFSEKVKYAPQTEYYMFSWSDSISYHSAGIPAITNDPISEQYYEGTGPYVGRDHSNFDNWDVFDVKILEDVSRYYGGMGIYIDNLPYLTIDFLEMVERIRNEVSREMLEAFGIEHEGYDAAVIKLEEAAKAANAEAAEGNEKYMAALSKGITPEEKERQFAEASRFNTKLLSAYKMVADDLDRYNAYDFIAFGSLKYLQNAGMLNDVKTALEEGDAEKAFEALAPIDLAASSYYFDEDVVEHMRKQICAPEFIDRRTWAAKRELNIYTYYNLVETFGSEMTTGKGFPRTIELINQAIANETELGDGEILREKACIEKIAETIGKE